MSLIPKLEIIYDEKTVSATFYERFVRDTYKYFLTDIRLFCRLQWENYPVTAFDVFCLKNDARCRVVILLSFCLKAVT